MLAKERIVEKVKAGFSTFDTSKVMVLNTDWSQVGVSMAVLQKHCVCVGVDIRCCPEGWKLVLCGSRFCSRAESLYSPVEGEALAVAWRLCKAKYFLLGASNLFVAVDHNPMLDL